MSQLLLLPVVMLLIAAVVTSLAFLALRNLSRRKFVAVREWINIKIETHELVRSGIFR
jgi:hypothetical protein